MAVASAGNYDVVITGPCGTATSTVAVLTVNTIPVITDQPDNDTKCVGESATFTVTATGTIVSYQWRKGGVNIGGANAASYTIASVATTDAGNYDVVVTGPCGTATSTAAVLTVNTIPVITDQPDDVVVCAGGNATFTVSATGGDLNYQWRKDGVNIPGATAASYTINGIAATDAGAFSVVISNSCGTTTSADAALTVNTVPVITDQPDSQTICAGDNVTFTVVSSGLNLTYQWQKNGAAISGANGSSYTIIGIANGDAANYTVVVTNECGTVTSDAATLTVNNAPVVTTQPTGVTECPGQSVTFTVASSGLDLTYLWRKNNVPLSPAVTTPSLTLNNIGAGDAGSYDVVITNPCGSTTSNAALLTVAENPAVTTHPTDIDRCEGDDISFSVVATGTGISYQWRKDGTNLLGETGTTLDITAITLADAGNYDVLVYGMCDTIASNPAVLLVYPATRADIIDSDTIVCKESNVEFNVAASGYGSLIYQWQRFYYGSWVDMGDDTHISGSTTAALTINMADMPDTGLYRVQVQAGCGSVFSEPVRLDVNSLIATIGTPAPFLINSATTTIEVQVEVEDHFLIFDMGFSLVAPDGTEVMLKSPIPNPCVYNSPVDINALFTNKLPSTDTMDYCLASNNITGTFGAAGDWSVLNGMDPSNGAWQVRVYDQDRAVPDPDGYLSLATLKFIDLDSDGDTAIVTYNSGPISEGIMNPLSSELRPTPYVVPIRLMTNCFNSEDAHAIVTVQGGIPPFTYEWTGPTVEPDEPDVMLGRGTYSVLVTDALGCTSIATVEVSSPPAIIFDDVVHTDTIICNGSADGIIRSKASGGAGSFTYTLLPGNMASAVADSGVFYGLTAGIYTIRATDINGCVQDTVIQIFEHAPLSVQVDLVQVTSPGTGSITLTASGGVAPYRYSIDNGATLQVSGYFPGLDAGFYPIYVVDTLGCTYTETVNLSLELLEVTVTKNDVTCGGYADGSFLLALTDPDGVGPYTLTGSFTDPQTVDAGFFSFTGQEIGLYDVRIVDSEGKVFVDTIEINGPPPIIVVLENITAATCSFNTADGAIDISVSGGTGTVYSYEWSNDATTEDLLNVPAGPYSVTITDEGGCMTVKYYDIGYEHFATADAGSDVMICPGIEYQLNGSPGHSVLWTSNNYPTIDNIADPTIILQETTEFIYQVTDEFGCYDQDTVNIYVYIVPEMLIYDIFNDEYADSVVYLEEGLPFAMGTSSGFFTYLWEPNIWITDNTLGEVIVTPLKDTVYTVTGTTLDGCPSTDYIRIIIRKPITIYTGFSPNADGVNDTWEIKNAEGYGDLIRVRVYNRWGEPVFESKGYGGSQKWDGTRNGRPMPVGSYYYIIDVKDGKSEPYTGTVTILR
ncbi:MAG: gliding motility-associated C-terminal domain-containing protein [Bacteroidales bacterium]